MTIAKVADGLTGADAYTVLLSNESHTFPGTTNTAVGGSIQTSVLAYKGTSASPATVVQNNITGLVTGMTAAVAGSPGNVVVTVTVTNALVAQSGFLTIPVTVDSITFNKIFSWTVSYTGAPASTIALTSTAQSLVASPGVTPTSPTTAVITGTGTNTTIDKYEYSLDGSATWLNLSPTPPAYVALDTTNKKVTITGATLPSSTIAVKMSNTASGVADSMTVAKLLNGAGIAGTAVTYQVHSNGTTAPIGTWLGIPTATIPGQFLWTRTVTSYTDASPSTTSYAVSAHGTTGSTGVGISNTTSPTRCTATEPRRQPGPG